jgi:uncharacterized membrane protein YedE/YeeE
LSSLLSGLLLGLGLVISGMADPAKVLNFLDFSGIWDPSLAFVMAGAVTVAFVGYRFAFMRGRPLFDRQFHLPTVKHADGRLVAGATIFGVGWGLSGLCPGPAVTSLVLAAQGTLVFVPFMLAGMWGARLIQRKAAGAPVPQN